MSRRLLDLPAPALLALIYLAGILIGTALLALPLTEDSLSLSEAVFTAVSAVTVTGLSVVNLSVEVSWFGQFVVLVLIQLGGLGLMTAAALVLSSLGLQIGLAQRSFIKHEMGVSTLAGLLDLAWVVLRIVVIVELLGALALALVFVPEFGWREGLWWAFFHAVSAFNNAGFALGADSLAAYASKVSVLVIVSTLFVVGGLGFAVLSDVLLLGRWRRFSLHTRLTLVGTIGLAAAAFAGYAILEWDNPRTLGSLASATERLTVAAFEGLTPRTAGFNVMDTSATRDSTALMTMVLMFIGGGSTSTAGGIKVTTFVVLLLATLAFFRASGRMQAFGYSIGLSQSLRLMALLTVSVFVLTTACFTLLVTQRHLSFLDIAFETTSAFATVGLSRGITAELDASGRLVLCVLMFLGRLGPLTLGYVLATRAAPRVAYPEGRVYLG